MKTKFSWLVLGLTLLLFLASCSGNNAVYSVPSLPSQSKVGSERTIPPARVPSTEDDTSIKNGSAASPKPSVTPPTPAKLTLQSSLLDFGTRSVNSLNTIYFKILNTGEQDATNVFLTGLAAPFGFKGGTYPGIGGTCSNTIGNNPNGCRIALSFYPTALTTNHATVTLHYNDNQSVALDLEGKGTDLASLSFYLLTDAVASYDFGSVAPSSHGDVTIGVRYAGIKQASGVVFSGLSNPLSVSSTTCASIISADCSITLRMTGISTGQLEQTLTIDYSNSAFATSERITLTGRAMKASQLTISDGGTNRFPDTARTKTAAKAFTITATGDYPITSLSALPFSSSLFSYKGGAYPGTSGTCGTTLVPPATCSLVVEFAPIVNGSFFDGISLQFFNGVSTVSAIGSISGNGVSPALLTVSTPTSNPFHFGSRALLRPLSQVFSIKNSGGVPATSFSFSPIGVPYTLSNNSCATASIAAGASCAVSVIFTPTVTGIFPASLTYSYHDGLAAQSAMFPLIGTGDPASELGFSTNTISFGTIAPGSTKSLRATVKKYGADFNAASNVSFAITGSAAFNVGALGSCATTVTADCTVELLFLPTASGNFTGTLNLTYTNSNNSVKNITIGLTGAASGIGVLTAPSSLDFGSVGTNSSKSLSLTLSSNGFLVTSVSQSGLSTPFSASSCGSSFSTNCTVTVTFAPSVVGTFNQVFKVLYNGGTGTQTLNISIMGIATPVPLVVLSGAAPITTPVNESGFSQITLTNNGTGPATLSLPGLLTPFRVLGNNCPPSLAANTNCRVDIAFLSASAGIFVQNYIVQINGIPKSTSLKGTATKPVQVAAGNFFTCAITDLGQTKCWGRNNFGQLGIGNTNTIGASANQMGANLQSVNLGTERTAKKLFTGYFNACAILDNDKVKCWGANSSGQLGLGDTLHRGDGSGEMGDALPVIDLGTDLTAIKLALGYEHVCALLSNGAIKCWGNNSEGQLGLGDISPRGDDPNEMGEMLPAVDLGLAATNIAAGANHTCALLVNGTLKCWGNNSYGQLGQGDNINRGDRNLQMGTALSAVDLGTSFGSVTTVAAGGANTMVVNSVGKVKSFGYNSSLNGLFFGQNSSGNIGPLSLAFPLALDSIGSNELHMGDYLPVVSLGSGLSVKTLSLSGSHVVVLFSNALVKAFGKNAFGQLGYGNNAELGGLASQMGDALPLVNYGFTPTQVSAGQTHTCVTDYTRVRCVGDAAFGLGYGNTNNIGDGAGEMGTQLLDIPLH